MEGVKDTYKTIVEDAEAVFKDKGSKFLTYAYPVTTEEQVKEKLEPLRKKYYDATHHCYAWRLGPQGEAFRANDDGEPSGTAGKPILGQMLSHELTNILIVVVRYFGGTKLGVPGLINAYRESAKEVIANCEVITKTVNAHYKIKFSYLAMNDVMKVVKDMHPDIISQTFDNLCEMELSIRESLSEQLSGKLGSSEGVEVEELGVW